MATGGNGRNFSPSNDPGTALRAGRVSALRDRMKKSGRTAMLGLSLMQAGAMPGERPDEGLRRDPVAELQANRHEANRFTNPGRVAPNLELAAASLREEGDEEDQSAAAEVEDSIDTIAEDNQIAQQAEGLVGQARAKSQVKAQTENALQASIKKGMKEFEETMKGLQNEAAAKFASAIDWGGMAEIADSIGTTFSSAHVALSIFGGSMSEQTKEFLVKAGMPVMKPHKFTDLLTAAGTNMQVEKWITILLVLLPFVIIFLLMMLYSACRATLACRTLFGLETLNIF